MKKLFKSKKGIELWIGLIMTIIVATGAAYIAFMSRNLKEPSGYLGEDQVNQLRINNMVREIDLWVKQSAKYSIYQTIYDLAENGGRDDCDKYSGYSLWYSEGRECYPDEKVIKKNFIKKFKEKFDDYLLKYPIANIPTDNYDFFIDEKEKLIVTGFAADNIEIPIVEKEVEKVMKEIKEEPYKTKYIIPEGAEEVLRKIISEYDSVIEKASKKFSVEKSLIVAVIAGESGGDQNKIGYKIKECVNDKVWCPGEKKFLYVDKDGNFIKKSELSNKGVPVSYGIMQIIEGTAERMGCADDFKTNAKTNIECGTKYLKHLMDYAKKYNLKTGITNIIGGYNGGEGAMKYSKDKGHEHQTVWENPNNKGYAETRKYVKDVLGYKKKYEEIKKVETGEIEKKEEVYELILGECSIKPSFYQEIDYSLNDYEIIKNQAKRLISTCSEKGGNKLKECIIKEKLKYYEETKERNPIKWLHDEECPQDGREDRTYKFCVTTGKKFLAYDNEDKEVKLREIIIKFALYFPIIE